MSVPALAGRRGFAAAGAVLAGCGVALAAYAAHGAEGADAARLAQAALQWQLHGVALVALDVAARPGGRAGRLRSLACSALLAGMLLFGGSLLLAVLIGASTALAPLGGLLLMLGWGLAAASLLHRSN